MSSVISSSSTKDSLYVERTSLIVFPTRLNPPYIKMKKCLIALINASKVTPVVIKSPIKNTIPTNKYVPHCPNK